MNKFNKRLWVVLGICIGCALIAMLLQGLVGNKSYAPLDEMELHTQDLRMRFGRKTPVDPRLVLIGIDRPVYAASDFREDTLQAAPVLRELQNDFPWSRSVWAELTGKLAGAGAKVIILDLIFSSPNAGDAVLRDSLERHKDKVITVYTLGVQNTERGDFVQLLAPNNTVLPSPNNDALVQDDRAAYALFRPDFDGIIRRVNFRQTGEQAGFVVSRDVVMHSLAARALQKFGRADLVPDGSDPVRFRYAGYGYKVHPIGDVLSPGIWEQNYQNGEFFRDKIVLVGPTAEIFHDRHNTAFAHLSDQMSGPEIHLNVIASALHGEFLRDASRAATLAVIALSGIFAGALCFIVRQPMKRLLAVVGLSAGYWFLAQLLFDQIGWVVPVVVPLLVLITSSIVLLAYDFVLERLERMKLRHTMGLYFSPRVLEAVLADPGSMTPRHADVTMLLTDLRNSTPLAEALGPGGMFELLNRVFEAQTGAIMSEEGNLEHFLGDQFLSYWGAPQPQSDAADRARRAATALITAMERLGASLPPDVRKLFGYGVALHSGRVLVGNKGSALRLDYGLVGDAVNEAARIEALTKYYGVKLLISRETFVQLGTPGLGRLVDRVVVKGKTGEVELFECENPRTPPDYEALCRRYKAAFDAYCLGHFNEARGLFSQLAEEYADGPSRALAARCAQLGAAPPADWKGIWKMESK
ncbi:MAG TPA: adenylate/guanylate cyclase domain-containing protein [Methylomirabilota bacterium]|nr:adenylate/guanylate cyclase domain-containing protein [Methylomirabilota bacterium]